MEYNENERWIEPYNYPRNKWLCNQKGIIPKSEHIKALNFIRLDNVPEANHLYSYNGQARYY